MNGDIQQLMEHISDLHSEQMAAIASVNSNFSEFKGKISEKVDNLERQQEKQSQRQWFHSVGVTVVAAMHQAAHVFLGWKV